MPDIVEFNEWVQKGLGRAVVRLHAEDPRPYKDAVLYTCTHETEDLSDGGSREQYYGDLIRAVGDEGFFRNGFLHALVTEPENPEKFDLGQTIELARSFAQNGDAEIKRAMYDAVARAGFSEQGYACGDLIRLDGIDALLFAADLFSPQIVDDDLWQVGSLISALQDRDGIESTNEAIEQASHQNPRLARMLERANESRLASEKRVFRRSTRLDYSALKQVIAEPGIRSYLFVWSRTATDEELEQVAHDLSIETDESRILAYLRIFRERQFPGSADRLLEFARRANIRIARGAIDVLSRVEAPAIRSLALSFFSSSPDRFGDAADLLVSNYETGDLQMIEARLREPIDAENRHHFGMGVKHLLGAHCSREAAPSLLMLYESVPCSMCRYTFVKHLIELQLLPDWMRNECRFDAYSETRNLVQ